MQMQAIQTDIQSLGVRSLEQGQGRAGGAGPAEGVTLVFAGAAVNVPVQRPYVQESPYSLRLGQGHILLCKDGQALFPVEPVQQPELYDHRTSDGVPYQQIALLHGNTCLASTVLQRCQYWHTPQQCTFCGIGLSLETGKTVAQKRPQQLAEVAVAARRQGLVEHVVLTTGSSNAFGSEIDYLAECTRAVKEASGLPVHVQFAPPKRLSSMDILKAAGVDTVGIHIESFHPETLRRTAPAKAAIGFDRYTEAWKYAVGLFGANQVSSFLIVGLGEPEESVILGSEILADLGVFPFIVPLRPIAGSILEQSRPPTPQAMGRIYEAVAPVLKRKGLSSHESLAGCVRCRACSALHRYESPPATTTCHSTRNEQELSEALAIRREIFVQEQGLFTDSDLDEHEEKSIHLVVKKQGEIVGTVRIYPENANHWVGGRLAVRSSSRDFRVGSLLVKEAVRRVKVLGGTSFHAAIQEKNVNFFKKIGWTAIGEPFVHHSAVHQRMEADLNRDFFSRGDDNG